MEVVTPEKDGRLEYLFHANRPIDDWSVNCGQIEDVRLEEGRILVDITVCRRQAQEHERYDAIRDRLMVTVEGASGPMFQALLSFQGREEVSTTIGLRA